MGEGEEEGLVLVALARVRVVFRVVCRERIWLQLK